MEYVRMDTLRPSHDTASAVVKLNLNLTVLFQEYRTYSNEGIRAILRNIGYMWDVTVLIPDHCLSIYFTSVSSFFYKELGW